MKNLFCKLHSITIVLTVSLLASCNQPSSCDFTNQDREDLKKIHHAIVEPAHQNPSAIDWKDYVEIHYTPDAKVLPPNGPIIEGRDAIVSFMLSFPPMSKYQTEDIEIEGNGNLAYIRGKYELEMIINDSTTVTDQGKYIELWRKDDSGSWKCIMDVFSSDIPMEQ